MSEVLSFPRLARPEVLELKRQLSAATVRARDAERRLAWREREVRELLARHRPANHQGET